MTMMTIIGTEGGENMNQKQFIENLRAMADDLENGGYHFMDLESGYLFGNRNYGEVSVEVSKGVHITVKLYSSSDDEKARWKDA